jgi:hypothetical protein
MLCICFLFRFFCFFTIQQEALHLMNRHLSSRLGDQLKEFGALGASFSYDHIDLLNRYQLFDDLSPGALIEVGRALREARKQVRSSHSAALPDLMEGALQTIRELDQARGQQDESMVGRFQSTERLFALRRLLLLIKREVRQDGSLEDAKGELAAQRIQYAEKVLDELVAIMSP